MRDTTRPAPTRPIGIIGHVGSGKDTVADFLCRDFGYHRAAYADALKREIYDSLRLRPALPNLGSHSARAAFLLYLEDHKRDAPDSISGWPRMLLQSWGTMRRDLSDPDYWVKRLPIEPDMVVSDVRFPNEVESILKAGGCIWRIIRPGTFAGEHQSDRALIGQASHAVIVNDGSLEALRTYVRATYRAITETRSYRDDPLSEVMP